MTEYSQSVGELFNQFMDLYEDKIRDFLKESGEPSKMMVLGIEYSGHPNSYADALTTRLRITGLSEVSHERIKLIDDVILNGTDVRGKQVLAVDIHSAPEDVVRKYLERILSAGARDVRYAAPTPKPLFYSLKELEGKKEGK